MMPLLWASFATFFCELSLISVIVTPPMAERKLRRVGLDDDLLQLLERKQYRLCKVRSQLPVSSKYFVFYIQY